MDLSAIEDPRFSLASIKARISNFDNTISKNKLYVIPPIICIKTEKFEDFAEDYILPSNKSNRGRRKKVKKNVKKFRSNMTFIIRLYSHRVPKKDVLSQTATACREHDNCEICAKSYTLRIFNGGKLVCVGIKNIDKSDFYECVDILVSYIAKCKVLTYLPLKMPDIMYKKLYAYYLDYYKIVNVESTLENYQFPVYKSINLYKLKDILIHKSSGCIINIDYEKLYKYMTDCIVEKSYAIKVDWLIETLILKKSVRKNFVDRKKFTEALNAIDLKKIESDFDIYWADFCERNRIQIKKEFIEFIKYSTLKLYIIQYFKPEQRTCDYLEDDIFESILFKEAKNTLIVKKNINGRSITYRLFVTGIINIQGSNNYPTAKMAQLKIIDVLGNGVLYDAREPPMVSWRDTLGRKLESL